MISTGKTRKTVFLILFLSLVLTVHADWFKDENFRFQINVPAKWQKAQYQEGRDHVFDFMSQDKKIAVQIRVFEAGSNTEASQLVDPFENVLVKDGIQKLSIDECLHNGTSGKLAVYTTGFDANGAGIAAFYAVKNGFGYIVLFILPNQLFDTYKTEMDQIMKSFKILDPVEDLAKNDPLENVSLIKITSLQLYTNNQETENQDNSGLVFEDDVQKIFATFKYKSAGNPQAMIIRWVNTDNGTELSRTIHQAVSVPSGQGNADLSRPNRGWDPGNYRVELLHNNEVLKFRSFKIEEPKSPIVAVKSTETIKQESEPEPKPEVEATSMNESAEKPVENKMTSANHYYKQIKLGPSESFNFQTGSVDKKPDDDLVMEYSCDYTKPVIKGNFVLTGKKDFLEVESPPGNNAFDSSSDNDINILPLKEVAIFKLEDGTYAKFKVVKHAFLEAVSEPKCRHYIEAIVEYPAFQ